MKVFQANSLDDKTEIRQEISTIFTDGFYQWLHYFSKDKKRLVKAFSHMFNLHVFHVAIKNDQVAAIAALTDLNNKAVKIDGRQLRKNLGFFRGRIASVILKQYFEKKTYPFPITKEMAMIEFVATAINFRRQGIAESLIRELINTSNYSDYVLEVADTNTAAVDLYQKLGFVEFMKIEEKRPQKSGVNYLVYMKYTKVKSN